MDSDIIPHPFHRGELAAQDLAGGGPSSYAIRHRMPAQHQDFFPQLRFLCVGVTDAAGWPIATLLSGPRGFVSATSADRLYIASLPAPDDPAFELRDGAPVGILGIDLVTRRRNRANGTLTRLCGGISVAVEQSFGNCPRYIVTRQLAEVTRPPGETSSCAGLDEASRALLERCSTFFIATTSGSALQSEHGGVDISHRGGAPGFIDVEGDVLTVPEYPGNRYFNTLGNLVEDTRASIVLVDFETGDILQLQGRVAISWNEAAEGDPAVQRTWRFSVVRSWLRRGAFALGEVQKGPE